MFHILVQARLTEKQFKFGFNPRTIVFELFDSLKLRSTLFDSLKLCLTNFSGHKYVKHLVGKLYNCNFFGQVRFFSRYTGPPADRENASCHQFQTFTD